MIAWGGVFDIASALRSTKKKSEKLPAAPIVPESWIVRLPSGVVITKCERSRVEFVMFLNSIHSSLEDALVPDHAISFMRSGCVVTKTVLSVEVAVSPFDLYATTANVVVAAATTLLVAEIAVVVPSKTVSFTIP